MSSSQKNVWKFNYHLCYIYMLTLLLLFMMNSIHEINGQINAYNWKKHLQEDTNYLPINRMTLNSLLNNNNDQPQPQQQQAYEEKTIRTRAAEIVPPERPFIFETPEALRTYLHKLNEYFAIIGRPRFGRR
ncbi:unnamed protein product [Schistosoma turkestanicum]|nr:unnamed protein product [Schistosoma turkestanicum]